MIPPVCYYHQALPWHSLPDLPDDSTPKIIAALIRRIGIWRDRAIIPIRGRHVVWTLKKKRMVIILMEVEEEAEVIHLVGAAMTTTSTSSSSLSSSSLGDACCDRPPRCLDPHHRDARPAFYSYSCRCPWRYSGLKVTRGRRDAQYCWLSSAMVHRSAIYKSLLIIDYEFGRFRF